MNCTEYWYVLLQILNTCTYNDDDDDDNYAIKFPQLYLQSSYIPFDWIQIAKVFCILKSIKKSYTVFIFQGRLDSAKMNDMTSYKLHVISIFQKYVSHMILNVI